jgi:HTH-type transcriptional regulator/antitoxin HigA
MQIQPVRTEADYDAAVERIAELMGTELDPEEGDELDILATLVLAYEAKHFPMNTPDPVKIIRFQMEQLGMTRKDLEPMIGSRARVSEVLNGKRSLTLPMIRRLHEGLHIPLDLLVGVSPSLHRTARRNRRKPAAPAARSGRRTSNQQSVR